MASAKYYDTVSGAWKAIASAGQDGVGVPVGGALNQVLAKKSAANYDTEWVDLSAGGGAGITWNNVTGLTQAADVDNGYIANNASQVTVTLPNTAAVGKTVRVIGSGAGGWKIAQPAGDNIVFGIQTTTTGTGGYLASINRYDAVELVCIVANSTWSVISSQGNIEIA